MSIFLPERNVNIKWNSVSTPVCEGPHVTAAIWPCIFSLLQNIRYDENKFDNTNVLQQQLRFVT